MEKLIQGLEEEGLKRAASTCERHIYDLVELKRRSRVVEAFLNEKSLARLAVTILIDINEEWLTERRYLNLEE